MNRLLAEVAPITNNVVSGFVGKTPDQSEEIFGKFFGALIGLLLTVATLYTLIQLIQGGIQWISSSGDKTAVEAARNRITHALIGLIIVVGAWSIFLVVLQFLGLSSGGFNLVLPTLF